MKPSSTSYVSLQDQGRAPPYGSRHRGGGGCLRRFCFCCFSCWGCCICYLLIIIFILLAIVAALYFFFRPYIPTYNVENLGVTCFDIRNDGKIYTEFAVVVKSENPNKDIGLDYGDNNVTIIYSGSQLCTGSFPPFLQPGKNTTMVNITLKGDREFGSGAQQEFMQQQKDGKIPLLIIAKIPVRLVIHDFLHLWKFKVDVNCSLVIDHLEHDKKPNITKKEFTYGIEF